MAEAARTVLAAATALTALGLLGACADQSKRRESELAQLLGWLPGRYDNTAQADGDPQRGVQPHDRIALTIVKVYTPRLGHHVFYVQEMAADDPRRVMSERMFSFKVDEKRGIVETVYTFTEPLRWRDGQRNIQLFTSVMTEDVQSVGCELLWKKSGEQFIASYDPQLCHDSGNSAAELTADSLAIPDARAAGPGGRATEAYYRFRKTR